MVTIRCKVANRKETIDILECSVGLARTLMSADVAAIALPNESSGQLILKCHANEEGIQKISCDKINETVVLRAVQNEQAIRFPDDYGMGTELGWYCPIFGEIYPICHHSACDV